MAKGSGIARKTMARLVAVQMIYSQNFEPQNTKAILSRMRDEGLMLEEGTEWVDPDLDLLSSVLQGYEEHRDVIDEALKTMIKPDQFADPLLSSILKAGAFELLYNTDTDAPIIITDYLSVTQAFYDGSETKLINGVLDRMSKSARS